MADISSIQEHMEVVGNDGAHVGTVDYVEDGARIKLTKSDSTDGMHHYLANDQVASVDDKVHLTCAASEANLTVAD